MFSGSIVALVTPMKVSGEIDYQAFSYLIDWHLEQGTEGLVVLGTTGESPTITPTERSELLSLAVKQAKGKIPIIAGTGVNSTHGSIVLTQQAMELGVDAALIVTPYYNKPTQEGLYQHFKSIAQSVPIPQILYNVPSRTGCDLHTETILKLSALPNIVGIKDASADIARVSELLGADCQLDLLSGDDRSALAFMLSGGKGVISVAANLVPHLFAKLCQAANKQHKQEASLINQQLIPLINALSTESNPIPVKWALAQMGLIEIGIRLPLTTLHTQHHQQVQHSLDLLDLTTKNFVNGDC